MDEEMTEWMSGQWGQRDVRGDMDSEEGGRKREPEEGER